MVKIYRKIVDNVKYILKKNSSTFAGTLVFYMLLTLMPITVWLTILLGKTDSVVQKITSFSAFSSVKNIIDYVVNQAIITSNGVSAFFLITALYSATTLFFHLQRIGEMIYGVKERRNGIKIRLFSVLYLVAVFLLSAISLSGAVAVFYFFNNYLYGILSEIVGYLIISVISFVFVFLLNIYVCPYKTKKRNFLFGSILTVVFWIFSLIGFSVYLKFSSKSELYGYIGTFTVFLLWLYLLSNCFIIGVIINERRVEKKSLKKW